MSAKIALGLTIAMLMLLGAFLPQTPLNIPTASATTAPVFPSYYYTPRAQRYQFISFNDPTSEFTALQGGSIDTMEWPLTQSQASTLQAAPQYQVNVSNDLGMVQVVFDGGRFPSNYTAFRQAVSLMIDRSDVVTTALHGQGGVMPDQLTPSWPVAYHVPGGAGWDINLALANKTLYDGGFRYTGGLGGFWYNLVNATNQINPATTMFYSRSDDPLRLYIGIQVATMQGATKATYHFDRLFTVAPVTSYITTRTAYRSPEQGNYNSNNCLGSGFPCFTAYTQGLGFTIPDPAYMFFSFGTTYLDISYQNFGHWVNSTINSLAESFYFDSTLNNTKVQLLNKYVTEQAWWDPIYYQQLYQGTTDRVTGFLSGQNSVVPNGPFYYSNAWSYWRGHLKGRLYGGTIRVGIYNPLNQLNVFNPDSNWVYDAQVYNRIWDSLLNFNYDTGGYTAGMALSYTVSTFTAPVYDSMFGRGSGSQWHTSAASPYWVHNNTGTHIVTGTHMSFTLASNVTWQDATPVTANDVMWNIVTDAVDPTNLLNLPYATLDDVNVTGNTVDLYFNSTGYDLFLSAALQYVLPPGPWINHAGGAAAWATSAGIVSTVSLASKAAICPGTLSNMMLLGSGPYTFDCSSGDPFTVGTPFDLVAYDGYVYADPNKATYTTGIAPMGEPYANVALGGTVPIKVALVNGANTKGLSFAGGKYVPDPTTVSDTTTGATVIAEVYESPSHTVTLVYNSGTKFWEGALPTTGLTGGTYHVKITATKTGSLPTTYGPAGTSQASAVGVSWEGDKINTAFVITGPTTTTPVSPIQLLMALITVLSVIPVARRAKQIRV